MEGIWRFALIALVAVAGGAGVGVLLGSANSDPFETVVKTVAGKPRTVTDTKTETVTKTQTETVTESQGIDEPVDGSSGTGEDADDDADGDNCSDSYDVACLDPSDGYNDLECPEVAEQDFGSVGSDPYGLDRDGDGIACESY